MTTARNAACPCGSGKKFKRCCGADADAAEVTQDLVMPTAQSKGRMALPIGLVGIAIAVGVGVGTLRDSVADGLAVSFALVMGVMIYLMARNPPEGTGTGGGTAINFGLDGRSRRKGGQNRRQRRRK